MDEEIWSSVLYGDEHRDLGAKFGTIVEERTAGYGVREIRSDN